MDAKEDIKSKLALEDVAAEYIELKRAGRNFKALSPFSNEKSPSFMVSPEKQIWHDFSSGKGGDMFSLVMELEGLDFKGALEQLARKAGVDLSQYQSGQSADFSKQKNRLYECIESAARFYQVQFSKHRGALEYILKKRQYSKEIALLFRIGYSPNSGGALAEHLLKKGFSEDEIKRSGLGSNRYGRMNDMFRGRIMVPLMDAQGRVVGFTARLLKDDPNAPKYINTPQTVLYDKGRHVFGLHLAKDSIRKQKFVVAVEGNLDVIASHQANVANVVATAGTAMTEMHLKELARFTEDIRLAFDQDQAGLNATERSIPLASKVNVSLRIITVPEGKDPDELIKKDPQLWQAALEDYQYAIDWLMDQYAKKHDTSTGDGKKAFTDAILPVVAKLEDNVEKEHYLDQISQKIGISKDALIAKLEQQKPEYKPRKKPIKAQKVTRVEAEATKAQNQLLALCLTQKDLRTVLTPLTPEMFDNTPSEIMFLLIKKLADKSPEIIIQKSAAEQNSADYGKMLLLLYEELYAGLEYVELQSEVARLQVRVIEQFVKAKKAELAAAMRLAKEDDEHSLLEKVKELDLLLRTAKETMRERQS